MGQKVNPVGLRLALNNDWNSRWFAGRNYGKLLHEDIKIRNFIKNEVSFAGISRVEIERTAEKMKINLHTARPGIVIGRKGSDVERLRESIQEMTASQVVINIFEVKRPELSAQLVSENIAQQLVKRVAFRRAMKKAVNIAMDMGAKGIKISCAGRLAGAEMSRCEWYREGRVPLHTLRAKIDYGTAIARTTYGIIGVKVWICLDEGRRKTIKAGEENAVNAKKGKVS